MTIKGTVKYQDLSGGFWGIVGAQGERWKPVKLPKKLQKEGLKIQAEAEEVQNIVSIFMWGTTIAIKNYNIL